MTDCPSQYSRARALVVVAGVEDSIAAIEDALTRSPDGREAQSLLVQAQQIHHSLRNQTFDPTVLKVKWSLDAARDALSSGETGLAVLELADAVKAMRTLEC
ncbi:MAG TPA: hypothetical protein VFA78_01510 [Chloroflexota bacterium]|nr:hypothetical protein [Chloroflexota bacterium]